MQALRARLASCTARLPRPALGRRAEAQVRQLAAGAGAAPSARLLRTGSFVDVGAWFRRGRIWLCLADDDLLLLADGHRPHIERIGRRHVAAGVYNAVTGELALSLATAGLPPRTVRLSPLDGYVVLAWARGEASEMT